MAPADGQRGEDLRGRAARRRASEARAVRRRRRVSGAALVVLAAVVAAIAIGRGSDHRATQTHPSGGAPRTSAARSLTAQQQTTAAPPRKPPARPPFAIAERVVRLVDHSREIKLPDGAAEPRTLLTYVRYPVRRSESGPVGPFPLVVFGHGYSLTPAPYGRLLDAWARAGYVVAAPVFPLENANAPGGPNESDLGNQPRDMSFVISRLLALSAAAGGAFSHLIDPARIAVAGHSDGGDTALAVAYDSYVRDARVRAVVILSGAEIPGLGGFRFPAGEPPLLATQGTADTINPLSATFGFYDIARRPKYLLTLSGAEHLGPYTDEQPQLRIVENVSTAFLDRYLKGDLAAGRRIVALGSVPGVSSLSAHP